VIFLGITNILINYFNNIHKNFIFKEKEEHGQNEIREIIEKALVCTAARIQERINHTKKVINYELNDHYNLKVFYIFKFLIFLVNYIIDGELVCGYSGKI
jgi:hypothetical protein